MGIDEINKINGINGSLGYNVQPNGDVLGFYGQKLFNIGPQSSATPPQPTQQGASMYQDPFGTAMSGTQKGTLQPFINRNTQLSSNALYGGLLGYQPQSMVAGNAGGTPVNSQVPQWRLPSAIPTPNQGQIGLLGPQANPQQQMGIFGNRSWMGA